MRLASSNGYNLWKERPKGKIFSKEIISSWVVNILAEFNQIRIKYIDGRKLRNWVESNSKFVKCTY